MHQQPDEEPRHPFSSLLLSTPKIFINEKNIQRPFLQHKYATVHAFQKNKHLEQDPFSRSRSHTFHGSKSMLMAANASSSTLAPSHHEKQQEPLFGPGNERKQRKRSQSQTRTFYEEFSQTFPNLVRENEKTAKRQSLQSDKTRLSSVSTAGIFTTMILESYRNDLKSEMDSKSSEMQTLEKKEEIILKQLEKIEQDLNQLTIKKMDLTQELELLRSQKEDLSDSLDYLADRISELEVSELSSDSDTFIFEYANQPKSISSYDDCIKTLTGHLMPVTCLDFVHPHEILVSGSEDCTIKIWDLGRWNLLKTLNGHQQPVRCLQYDGEFCLSAGDDAKINIWKIGNLMEKPLHYFDHQKEEDLLRASLFGHLSSIHCLQFDSKENTLMTGSADNTVRIWDLNTEKCLDILHFSAEHDLITSDNGNHKPVGLASITPFENQSRKGINCLQFYQHGLATGGFDGIIRLFDTRAKTSSPVSVYSDISENLVNVSRSTSESTSNCKRMLAGHTLPVTSLQFDHNYLISGSLDRSIRIWDLRMGLVVEGFMSHSNPGIQALQFDQNKIVSATGGQEVTIIDRETKKQMKWEGHLAMVRSLKFRQHRLITGADDSVIKLWDF